MHDGVVKDVGLSIHVKPPKKSNIRVSDILSQRAAKLAADLRKVYREYGCRAIIGEMPSGGAQSASAMAKMAVAAAAVSAMTASLDMPCEWCTPTDVKVAATGLKSGTKPEIMDAVAKKYGWHVDVKQTKTSERKTFHVPTVEGTRKLPGGQFEDIADAIVAYWAMETSNLVKMFG